MNPRDALIVALDVENVEDPGQPVGRIKQPVDDCRLAGNFNFVFRTHSAGRFGSGRCGISLMSPTYPSTPNDSTRKGIVTRM